MNEQDFRMDVVERLARIETKMDPLQDLEPRIAALERFKYKLVAVATAAGGIVSFLVEHASSVAATLAALIHKAG